MVRRFNDKYRLTDQSRTGAETFNPINQDIDERLNAQEELRSEIEELQRNLVAQAAGRIDDVLLPALEYVQEIQQGGFLSASILEGSALSFVEGEIAFAIDPMQKAIFRPTPFVALLRSSTHEDWAVGQVLDYDSETGILTLDIVSVEGDDGPHEDVIVSATSGSAQAQIAYLHQAAILRDEVDGIRIATEAIRAATQTLSTTAVGAAATAVGASGDATTKAAEAAASAILAGRYATEAVDVPITTGVFSAKHWATKAAASAAAAALFDPSSYYTKSASDARYPAIADFTALAASAPGRIAGTAVGALTKGDVVALNDDGTLSKVAATGALGVYGAYNQSITLPAITNGFGPHSDICYFPSLGRGLILYANASQYPTIQGFTPNADNNKLDVDATAVVLVSVIHSAQSAIMADPATNIACAVLWNNSTSAITVKKITSTAVGTHTVDATTISIAGASGGQILGLWAIGSNKFVIFYHDATANELRMRVIDLSGTPTAGTVVTVETGSTAGYQYSSSYSNSLVWDATLGYGIIAYTAISNDTIYGKKFTISGTTITLSARQTLHDNAVPASEAVNAVYLYRLGTVFVMAVTGNFVDTRRRTLLKRVDWSGASPAYGPIWYSIQTLGQIATPYRYQVDNAGVASYIVNGIEMEIFLVGGEPVMAALNSASNAFGGPNTAVTPVALYYDATRAKFVLFSYSGTVLYAFSYTSNTLRFNADKFVGIAAATVANGVATAALTIGAVADGLSGLTIGRSYSVKYDGTLGEGTLSTGFYNGKIGVAVAADKLLLTDIGGRTL